MNIIQMQDDLKGLPDQELVNEVQTNKADVLLNFVDEAANH